MALQIFINIRYLINVRSKSILLRSKELKELPVIENAFLIIDNNLIDGFGLMKDFETISHDPQFIVNVKGQSILPCWCDSHTHLVFADSRESEFIDKIKGLSYADIAEKGGGILSSV